MPRFLGVSFVVLCTLAAGCSPAATDASAERTSPPATEAADDRAEVYTTAFTASVERYQTRVGDIQQEGQQALDSSSEDAVLEVYGALRDASAEAADDLDELDPPADLADLHGTLVQQLRRQREALDDVITAARARDDAALTEGLTSLAQLLVDVATTQHAIDEELARAP